jgi:hypothetical protein
MNAEVNHGENKRETPSQLWVYYSVTSSKTNIFMSWAWHVLQTSSNHPENLYILLTTPKLIRDLPSLPSPCFIMTQFPDSTLATRHVKSAVRLLWRPDQTASIICFHDTEVGSGFLFHPFLTNAEAGKEITPRSSYEKL